MKLLKKAMGYILLTSLLITGLNVPTLNAESAITLADFSFCFSDGTSTAKDLNDTYNTKADTGYSPTSGIMTSSRLFASVADPSKNDYRKLEWSDSQSYTYNSSTSAMPIMAASSKNTWGTTPYFLIKTSTKGYDNINISLILGGSKKGPSQYKLEYSTNGKSFSAINGTSMTLKDNKKMYPFNFTLTNLKNLENVYIRIIAASTTTIEGGSITQGTTSGETAINNIIIKGSAISSATNTPAATPSKSPANSSGNNTSVSSGSTGNNPLPGTATSKKKTLSKPSLTYYKAGRATVKGKAAKKATVTLTTGGKTYSAKATSKGRFKIKLDSKLKKGQIIKIYISKKNYNNSKTRKYTVK